AADGDDERVVAELALGQHLAALVVEVAGDAHHATGAVDTDQAAEAEGEAVPVRLGEVVDLLHSEIEAAGGDLVQQRLPQVGPAPVDPRDMRPAALAQPVAEPRYQLEPAGPSADHDDAMQMIGHAAQGPARLPLSSQGGCGHRPPTAGTQIRGCRTSAYR